MRDHSDKDRSPKIQSMTRRSPASVEMLVMSISSAEKRKLSPTPARRSRSGQSPPRLQPITPTRPPVTTAPIKAKAGMVNDPKKENPPMMPSAAVSEAPLDIPRI